MIFLPYFAVSYGQQVEEISKSSKYCHCNILKRQKVLNHGIKLENNKGTPSWKFSTREGLALVVALSSNNNSLLLKTLPAQPLRFSQGRGKRLVMSLEGPWEGHRRPAFLCAQERDVWVRGRNNKVKARFSLGCVVYSSTDKSREYSLI